MLKLTTLTATLLVVMASFIIPGHAGAQGAPRARVAVTGGIATDQRGVQSSAVTVAPVIDLAPDPSLAIRFGAEATRFATRAWALGVNGAVSGRSALAGSLALTLDASATATRLQGDAPGSFAIADAVPALELRVGSVALFGGARASAGRASRAGVVPGQPPLFGGPDGSATTVATTATGPLFGATITVTGADASSLRLVAREDRLATAAASAIDRSVTLAAARGSLAVSAGATMRRGTEEGTFGSVGLSLRLTPDVSLDAAAGRYARSVVLGTPGGRFASAGMSLRLGGGAADDRMARAAGVPAPRAGITRLTLRAPRARRVEVAGDFTDWKFVAAVRAANGVWYADLRIPSGQYRYAFRVDGTEWRVPDGATAVDDGLGGRSAWITVPTR